ncbi:Cleavage stimulation factor subunit 2 [Chionoecetes opilio]|uniref:Cleavage stimulation factor subunit 2 n=1 Tax=Chionoecetes opilio TaxID=41210 RepID=A0A8J5CTQ6_CHIOP|nr:Cleavage stimulation factor subunit 2 [Chionoecetes opilio]
MSRQPAGVEDVQEEGARASGGGEETRSGCCPDPPPYQRTVRSPSPLWVKDQRGRGEGGEGVVVLKGRKLQTEVARSPCKGFFDVGGGGGHYPARSKGEGFPERGNHSWWEAILEWEDKDPLSPPKKARRTRPKRFLRLLGGPVPRGPLATEEKLRDIFSQVGPVLSFKLMYDRESGKPKGYGFCEYKDQETALSAMRNLNGYEIGGRPLRVDNACTEKSRMEMQSLMMGPVVESPYGADVEPTKAPEAISNAVASLPPEQMYELMRQMKLCVRNNPQEARTMLMNNPQLAYALLQAQVVMRIIDPKTAVQILHGAREGLENILPPTNAPSQPPVMPNPPQQAPPPTLNGGPPIAPPTSGPPPPSNLPTRYPPPMGGGGPGNFQGPPPGPPPPRRRPPFPTTVYLDCARNISLSRKGLKFTRDPRGEFEGRGSLDSREPPPPQQPPPGKIGTLPSLPPAATPGTSGTETADFPASSPACGEPAREPPARDIRGSDRDYRNAPPAAPPTPAPAPVAGSPALPAPSESRDPRGCQGPSGSNPLPPLAAATQQAPPRGVPPPSAGGSPLPSSLAGQDQEKLPPNAGFYPQLKEKIRVTD